MFQNLTSCLQICKIMVTTCIFMTSNFRVLGSIMSLLGPNFARNHFQDLSCCITKTSFSILHFPLSNVLFFLWYIMFGLEKYPNTNKLVDVIRQLKFLINSSQLTLLRSWYYTPKGKILMSSLISNIDSR